MSEDSCSNKGFELLQRFIWKKHPLWEELHFSGTNSTCMGSTRKHMFTDIYLTHKAETSYHISPDMFMHNQTHAQKLAYIVSTKTLRSKLRNWFLRYRVVNNWSRIFCVRNMVIYVRLCTYALSVCLFKEQFIGLIEGDCHFRTLTASDSIFISIQPYFNQRDSVIYKNSMTKQKSYLVCSPSKGFR